MITDALLMALKYERGQGILLLDPLIMEMGDDKIVEYANRMVEEIESMLDMHLRVTQRRGRAVYLENLYANSDAM